MILPVVAAQAGAAAAPFGTPKENIPGAPLMLAAYAVLWVILLVWMAAQARRQRALRADIERLRREIEAARAHSSGEPGQEAAHKESGL